MRRILLFYLLFFVENISAQTVVQKLDKAWSAFVRDEQLRHAIVGFSVVDSKTGKPIFERNAQVGLAPASTQKIITSVAAFELLGKEYRYKTIFRLDKNLHIDRPPYLEIYSSGDPTFGSWRFSNCTDSVILKGFVKEFRKKFPGKFGGKLIVIDSHFGNPLPGGYTWEDMGNYYGAGSRQLNWHENQYDLYFNSTQFAEVDLVKVEPEQPQVEFRNLVKADPSVKGDEIIVYSAPKSKIIYLEGRMPVGKNNFIVSGAMTDPAYTFLTTLNKLLKEDLEIEIRGRENLSAREILKRNGPPEYQTIYTHYSPIFDTINYHFLRKSINLYGEALIKTFAFEKIGSGSTELGIKIVHDFFASKGIKIVTLNIIDGSGLSPQNRVTTDALVKVLQYARTRPWFQSFYNALPEYNGMKMKSGSISGVRAYAGYHKATSGKEYSFSIIVNNFNGSSAEIVTKMYKLLDLLK